MTGRKLNNNADVFSLLVLLIAAVVAYWPVSFGIYSLKNDALNYFLPVRYQVSEAISNGYWPFWSPYFNLGYPLHGDMQSGVWNPVVQLLSLFGPYTLRTLQWETLFYVYLSGVGMFFLVRHFIKDRRICLLAASAFMLCGFNSDSAQFLNWISAASFLPFCFLFYYRMLTEGSKRSSLLFALFFYLLFVTSYPADFILSAYLFLALFVWHLFKKENRIKNVVLKLAGLHFLAALVFILLSLPAIISYAEFLGLTERGGGASYQDVMSNPLHPGLLISYITPLPVWRASFASMTDPLERNSFFGLVPFALLVLSFFIRFENRQIRFFKWAFILSVLFSFGEWGGIRIISYYILPLMSTFRHPANAKLFSIFFACMLAVFALRQAIRVGLFRERRNAFFVLAAVSGGLLIWAFAGNIHLFSSDFPGFRPSALKNFLESLQFSDLLLFNIILQLPFLFCLYWFLVRKVDLKALLLLSLLNSVLHTMLVQPFTVVKKDSVATIQQRIDQIKQRGFPNPDLNATLAANSREGALYFDELGAANMYNKMIGRIDYRICPNNLLRQNEFWFNNRVKDHFMKYPLFYKADIAILEVDSASLEASEARAVLVENKTIREIIPASPHSAYTAVVRKFSPNELQVDLQCGQPGFYAIFQNHYPRWQLKIDGREEQLQRVNISFMGFKLPAGDHRISLTYKSADLKLAFLLSLITLVTLLALIIYMRERRY